MKAIDAKTFNEMEAFVKDLESRPTERLLRDLPELVALSESKFSIISYVVAKKFRHAHAEGRDTIRESVASTLERLPRGEERDRVTDILRSTAARSRVPFRPTRSDGGGDDTGSKRCFGTPDFENPADWRMLMPPTLANGKICYIEIPATDIVSSVTFYQAVFGWKVRRRGDGQTAFDDSVGEVSGTGRSRAEPLRANPVCFSTLWSMTLPPPSRRSSHMAASSCSRSAPTRPRSLRGSKDPGNVSGSLSGAGPRLLCLAGSFVSMRRSRRKSPRQLRVRHSRWLETIMDRCRVPCCTIPPRVHSVEAEVRVAVPKPILFSFTPAEATTFDRHDKRRPAWRAV